MKKAKSRFPVRAALIILLCLCVISLVLFLCLRYLTSSVYFKVGQSEFFSGRNIFKINLSRQAQELTDAYPDYKRVILRRSLPDRIIADFIPREAIAILELSDNFLVDEEGVLFRRVSQEDENPQLPLITGLRRLIRQPQPGLKCDDDLSPAILEFINGINRDAKLAGLLKIRQINSANANDIFMFTAGGCKINLGSVESLKKNLSILGKLINDINSDLTKAEYIDLRFKEPVIKYR